MILSISSGMESFIQFLTVLILFLFVLGITYVTTRYIVKFEKNKIKTGNMELIEALRISNNKYLQVVKVGNRFFCIAVCKDTVTMLGEVDEQELNISKDNEGTTVDFKEIFKKVKQKKFGNQKE